MMLEFVLVEVFPDLPKRRRVLVDVGAVIETSTAQTCEVISVGGLLYEVAEAYDTVAKRVQNSRK